MRTIASIGLTCCCLAAALVQAGDPPDLRKIERRLSTEPKYRSQPLYGLVVFGPEAKSRVWLVLDKSAPAADRYDVLYADLNGNGDLTEAAEKFTAEVAKADVRFTLPDFKDPATGATHTTLSARVSAGPEPTVMISMKWNGGHKFGGGYPADPENGYLKLATSAAAAPVLWANGDGPFRFQRWYSGKLTIDAADDLKVFVGQVGVGPSSFCAFQQHMLPDAEGVEATLIYKSADGKEHKLTSRLIDRC